MAVDAQGRRLLTMECVTSSESIVMCCCRQGVTAVVSCTAAIVRPKEGDGPDRAKYFQGITFYEPEARHGLLVVRTPFSQSWIIVPLPSLLLL